MRAARIILAILASAATLSPLGCTPGITADTGDDDDDDQQPAGPDDPQRVSKLACLRKMSLDLTHASPTAANIQRVVDGDVTIEQLAEEFLESPEFDKVAFDWMREEFTPTSLTTAETDVEEPARIMHYVLMQDRDWREILTATYTVDKAGVEQAVTDRPAAGILSTRYSLQSTVGSFRRNWAARFERQFAGITLVAVTLPAGDMSDVSPDGLAANPNCAGCHVHPTYGIDPLARFAQCYDDDGLRKAGCTDPEGQFLLQKGTGLPDLGRITANTNEFKSQSVDFFFKRLFGRNIAREEVAFYTEAATAFAASGYQARALIKHLVTSEAYCSR